MYSFVETEERDNLHKQLFKMNITMPSMLSQEVNKRLDSNWEQSNRYTDYNTSLKNVETQTNRLQSREYRSRTVCSNQRKRNPPHNIKSYNIDGSWIQSYPQNYEGSPNQEEGNVTLFMFRQFLKTNHTSRQQQINYYNNLKSYSFVPIKVSDLTAKTPSKHENSLTIKSKGYKQPTQVQQKPMAHAPIIKNMLLSSPKTPFQESQREKAQKLKIAQECMTPKQQIIRKILHSGGKLRNYINKKQLNHNESPLNIQGYQQSERKTTQGSRRINAIQTSATVSLPRKQISPQYNTVQISKRKELNLAERMFQQPIIDKPHLFYNSQIFPFVH